MQIADLLTPERVSASLPAVSKKRVLEKMSDLLGADASGAGAPAVFQSLIERERLGSTGIGEGVALPHGRMKGLKHPLGAFARLEQAIDYEALDRKPVRLVFALIVPQEATGEHLQILARLAATFNDKALRAHLLEAKSAEEIYNCLTGKPASSPARP
jgi:PTS system nitrogen regulatory IIA component